MSPNPHIPALSAEDPDRWLNTAEAAALLGWSKRALDARRCYGRASPPFARFGRIVRYRRRDVLAWALAQIETPKPPPVEAGATEGGES